MTEPKENIGPRTLEVRRGHFGKKYRVTVTEAMAETWAERNALAMAAMNTVLWGPPRDFNTGKVLSPEQLGKKLDALAKQVGEALTAQGAPGDDKAYVSKVMDAYYKSKSKQK